jgi:SAM-dependent methyltransferase
MEGMASFTCNICGRYNEVERFATEPASCGCGSNVRLRALVHLLSMELFGLSLPLPEFPRIEAIAGLGMTDKECYAAPLAQKFSYANTFYARDPRFDISARHPREYGAYDFMLSADVLEHIAPPLERALEETCLLLKPHGFLAATVYCDAGGELREHFPDLHDYRIVPLGGAPVLINRRRDGTVEISSDLKFHGGSGATLEMRDLGLAGLEAALLRSGFREVSYLTDDIPEIGVHFDHDVSQPFIARKEPFVFDGDARRQLIERWRSERRQAAGLEARMGLAAQSRWLRLGRLFGAGPRLT